MAYKGFVGSGTVGHFNSTTVLELQFPAQAYAGREATVEVTAGTATHYFSDGISWKAVPTYATDSSGNVTGLVGPSGGVVPTPVFGLVAGSSSSKLTNAAIIQAYLNLCGRIEIPANLGVVSMAGTLTIYSDTHLVIGEGTTLQRENVTTGSTGVKMFVNANWQSTVFTVTGNLTASAPAWGNGFWATVTATITAGTIVAGGYVIVKGDTSGNYNGVFKVTAATATQVTWAMPLSTTGIPTSTGTITIAQADANITLEVNGYLDGGISNSVDATVDGLDKMGVILNKVGNLYVPRFQGGGFAKYCIHCANMWAPKFGWLKFNNGSDGLHFNSPAWSVEIGTVNGRTGDDALAFTANNIGYTQYALPDDTGDFDGVSVGNVDMDYALTNAVGMYPASGQKFRGFKFGRVINRSATNGTTVTVSSNSSLVGVVDDLTIDYLDGTGQLFGYNNCYIASLTVGFVPPGVAGLPDVGITTTGTTTSGSVSMTSVANTTGLLRGAAVYGANIAPGARVIGISGSTVTMSQPAVASGAAAAVQFLVPPARSKGVIVANANGKIGTLKLSGHVYMSTLTTTSNQGVISFQQGNNSGAETVILDGVRLLGVGDNSKSASLFLQGSTNTVASVIVSNPVIEGFANLADGSGAYGTRFNVLNAVMRDAQFLFGDMNGAQISVTGLSVENTLSGPTFNLYGTSHTYNLALQGVIDNNTSGQALIGYGTTNTINLKVSDGSIKVDGTKVTPATGAIFYNTNAAYGAGVGTYAMGAASTTRIAA